MVSGFDKIYPQANFSSIFDSVQNIAKKAELTRPTAYEIIKKIRRKTAANKKPRGFAAGQNLFGLILP